MTNLSYSNKIVLNKLKTAYDQLSWYESFFFPGALAIELNKINDANPSIENAFHVYNALVNHTYVFQRQAFRAIEEFSNSKLVCAMSILKITDLLTGDTAKFNRDAVLGHQNPQVVAEVLCTLQTASLLTGDAAQANRDAVVGHKIPKAVADALSILQTAGLLTGSAAQGNFDTVIRHQMLRYGHIYDALRVLNSAGFLRGSSAQANFDAVLGHQMLRDGHIYEALQLLYIAGFLRGSSAQANFDAVVGHQTPKAVAEALCTLQTARLLTGDAAQANRNAVARHEKPGAIARALCALETANLLTGDVAQINRDAVITYSTILLAVDPNTRMEIWSIIPPRQLTAARFRDIINLAAEHRDYPAIGIQAVNTYINNNILNIERRQNPAQNIDARHAHAPVFNTRQSTHTASIHKSSSSINNHPTFFVPVQSTNASHVDPVEKAPDGCVLS